MVAILGLGIPFLVIDIAFFSSNILKVPDGGWFPILVGVFVYMLMTTWRKGRKILSQRLAAQSMSTEDFLLQLAGNHIPRVPGTAVFMSRNAEGVPTTLLHNIKHNKVVHSARIFPRRNGTSGMSSGSGCTVSRCISASWRTRTSRPRWTGSVRSRCRSIR
jgi:K+ transporter